MKAGWVGVSGCTTATGAVSPGTSQAANHGWLRGSPQYSSPRWDRRPTFAASRAATAATGEPFTQTPPNPPAQRDLFVVALDPATPPSPPPFLYSRRQRPLRPQLASRSPRRRQTPSPHKHVAAGVGLGPAETAVVLAEVDGQDGGVHRMP